MPSSALITSRITYMERCLNKVMQVEKESGNRSGIIWVLDLQGLKFNSWTLAFLNGPFKTFCEFAKDHYVELTQKILVLNSGKFLHSLWRMLHPIIPQVTKNKIRFLGPNGLLELRRILTSRNLPIPYGGTLQASVKSPEVLPLESYYFPSLNEPPELMLQSKKISRHGTFTEELNVTEIGCNLQWFFKCDGEVTFGVFYSPNRTSAVDVKNCLKSDIEMLVPLLNITPNYIPENGKWNCDKIGWYFFVFGNPSCIVSRTLKHQLRMNAASCLQLQMRVDCGEEASLY